LDNARVVITGSTRGVGFCMAREFLKRGCAVVVSGRTQSAAKQAAAALSREVSGSVVHAVACDTGSYEQVQALWDQSAKLLGGVDHWINNAGIGQPTLPIWDVEPRLMDDVVRTDLLGVLYGARVAMRGMATQASGAIWFMEGHGSNGRIMKGLSVYGAAKHALRYVVRALTVEAKGTKALVGALSPGLMITDFTMKQIDRSDKEAWERTKRVFNILADKPETVAAFLVPRILACKKSGALIAWLTNRKILWRFMTAGLAKRHPIED
jgi:NAD(P)-dependent dehydrogenase (short-subunit alcohol dehydrogenase family)